MECFYDNGLHFECNKCSDCCRKVPGFVYLSERDLTSLCDWFKLSLEEFIDKYCRWVGYYEGKEALALIELKNYDCIFWNQNCGCSAYGARPIQCSTYPFWSHIIQNRRSWDEEKKYCPGINEGPVHSKDEIDEQRYMYVHNTPITR